MPIEPGAVNTVFLHYEFQFLAQDLINLSGSPNQQLLPKYGARLTTHTG